MVGGQVYVKSTSALSPATYMDRTISNPHCGGVSSITEMVGNINVRPEDTSIRVGFKNVAITTFAFVGYPADSSKVVMVP